jgi:hypothetical protein
MHELDNDSFILGFLAALVPLRKELLLPKVVGPFDSIEVPIRRTLRCFI